MTLLLMALMVAGFFIPQDGSNALTYMFAHASVWHLAINLLTLYSFGRKLEREIGHMGTLLVFLSSALVGWLCQHPLIGASAGILGVMTMYCLLKPKSKVLWILPPVLIPAHWFVGVFAFSSFALWAFDLVPQVAHLAHVGGVLAAVLVWFLVRPSNVA